MCERRLRSISVNRKDSALKKEEVFVNLPMALFASREAMVVGGNMKGLFDVVVGGSGDEVRCCKATFGCGGEASPKRLRPNSTFSEAIKFPNIHVEIDKKDAA